MFIETGLKKPEFLKGFCNLMFSVFSFAVKKMLVEIRLCNLTYAFKGDVKFAKMYMVKFIVSILNRLKILSKYINMMSF